jgi:hypothetical protein
MPDLKKLSEAITEAVDKITNQKDTDSIFLRECGIGGEI